MTKNTSIFVPLQYEKLLFLNKKRNLSSLSISSSNDFLNSNVNTNQHQQKRLFMSSSMADLLKKSFGPDLINKVIADDNTQNNKTSSNNLNSNHSKDITNEKLNIS